MAHGGKREGAGRKKVPYRKVTMAMRVSPACSQWIRDNAESMGMSIGEFVEYMVREKDGC